MSAEVDRASRGGYTLFDLGLQAERTALSWRRTSLSIVAAGALLLRLSVEVLGQPGLVVALGCLVLAVVSGAAGDGRYRRTAAHLACSGRVPNFGSVAALMAGAVTATGIVVLILAVHLLLAR